MPARSMTAAILFARIALAVEFLSAVADRFGFWGLAGAPNVAWGNWTSFLEYVAVLNWYAPPALIPILGWAATIAEIVFALGLLVGWRVHLFAFASGILLLLFAVTMVAALGIKAPLDYSVFAAAAAAFLLTAVTTPPATRTPSQGEERRSA